MVNCTRIRIIDPYCEKGHVRVCVVSCSVLSAYKIVLGHCTKLLKKGIEIFHTASLFLSGN